jgi:hypothetical protein
MRKLSAFAAFLIGLLFIWMAYGSIGKLDEIVTVPALPLVPSVDKALEIRVQQSAALAQLSLVVLGGLVTLFLAKPKEAGLTRIGEAWPEYLMASTACLLLLTSFYAGDRYVDRLVDALTSVDRNLKQLTEVQRIPDVFDPKYESLRQVQFWLLISGGAFGTFPFLSLRLSK